MTPEPLVFDTSNESYSTRRRPESPRDVLRNRVGVTASLFTAAMGLSYLFGRRQ